jgi:hypothetical protein
MITAKFSIKNTVETLFVEFIANAMDFSLVESGASKGKFVHCGDIDWNKSDFTESENSDIELFLSENEEVIEVLCENAKNLFEELDGDRFCDEY